MATMSTADVPARPLTRADWEALPEDDGYRYELIDGELVVSAAPRVRHQVVLSGLNDLMRAAAPADVLVLFAPLAVFLSDDSILEPDLVVAPRDRFEEMGIESAPLLAVEVLSPSTRLVDLTRKRDRLRRAGCPHYWVVDPDEPSVLAWELLEGEYDEAGRAAGEETLRLDRPFPVEVTPADLLRH